MRSDGLPHTSLLSGSILPLAKVGLVLAEVALVGSLLNHVLGDNRPRNTLQPPSPGGP